MEHGVRPKDASADNGGRRSRWASLQKFLYLGLGVKRWLLLGAFGIGVCSVGLAFVIHNVFDLPLPNVLPWYFEGVLVATLGVMAVLLSIYGLYRSVGPLLFTSPGIDALADTIYRRRSRGRGPKIVAIGGGTGLSVLLRGLKAHTDNLSAIVTVSDDGGSSGRLRREMGVLPPGDFRNCLVAMSDSETLVGDLFQYRFDQGNGLQGHSFGNLFIVAMTNVTGSFERALYESSKVLAVHGQILPATVANLRLAARLGDGTIVRGESSITERGASIAEIFIEPGDAQAFPRAVEAIGEADLIVIGPGSLYTSVLPNLLVSGIADAIRQSDATKIYVNNVATQKGETDAYTVADHVAALQAHTFPAIVDYVLANSRPRELGPPFLGQPVTHDDRQIKHASLILDDLMDPGHPVRHDSATLAQAIVDIHEGKRSKVPSAKE